MAYLSDLRSQFRSSDSFPSPYEITVYGGSFALVSGQKGLLVISDSEIVARVKKGKVRVYGENLKVDCASREEIYVSGKIRGVENVYDE